MLPTLYQYLFMITLPDEVAAETTAFKKELAEQIGPFMSLESTPHITIGSILVYEHKEDQLLKRIEFLCSQTAPMNIVLDGFSCFKYHTVFARLNQMETTRQLMNDCREAVRGFPSKGGWEPKVRNPHLTIGRELGEHFHTANDLFKDKSFHGSFEANNMTVRKREVEGKYAELTSFPFSKA
jgi:2'-5' RNA ligase